MSTALSGVRLAGLLLARLESAAKRLRGPARETAYDVPAPSLSGQTAAVAAHLLVFVIYSI